MKFAAESYLMDIALFVKGSCHAKRIILIYDIGWRIPGANLGHSPA
jgi:hypothetical protein